MSSSICYLTNTTITSTKEPADVSALYSINNKKKKSSSTDRDAAKSCAVSYLTNLNTNINQTQHKQSMHTQKTDSNNNMLLTSTLDYLNELHQQQQQQQHNSVIVNCDGRSIQNVNDINLDILCRNSNGTSSATSSIISNGTCNDRKISTTPPQQPSQKLKKK